MLAEQRMTKVPRTRSSKGNQSCRAGDGIGAFWIEASISGWGFVPPRGFGRSLTAQTRSRGREGVMVDPRVLWIDLGSFLW